MLCNDQRAGSLAKNQSEMAGLLVTRKWVFITLQPTSLGQIRLRSGSAFSTAECWMFLVSSYDKRFVMVLSCSLPDITKRLPLRVAKARSLSEKAERKLLSFMQLGTGLGRWETESVSSWYLRAEIFQAQDANLTPHTTCLLRLGTRRTSVM